ncbi:MAG: hypothetical protein HOO67_06985 [Candidatus Peribacteraceae bacterium]|nr:hypothetical protein [Candidatus Peribacteraceae bacterium]
MSRSRTSLASRSLLSRQELEDLHRILRAEIRAYVDRRVMDEDACIALPSIESFALFVTEHPTITIPTFADVLYRLTLSSVYNCFQFVGKSVRDPGNATLASQLTAEIALQLRLSTFPLIS